MTEKRWCETCAYFDVPRGIHPCGECLDYSRWAAGSAPVRVEAAPVNVRDKTALDLARRWAALVAGEPSLPEALDILVRTGRELDAIPADASEQITRLRDRIGELEGHEERADLLRECVEAAEEALAGRRSRKLQHAIDRGDSLSQAHLAAQEDIAVMVREAKIASDALDAAEINPNFTLGRRVEVLTKLYAEYQEANRKLVEHKSVAEREQLWCDHQMLGWDSKDGGLKPLCCAHLNEGLCFPCRKTEAECKRTAELGLLVSKCDYECTRLTAEERLSRQVDDLTATAKYALWEAYLRRGCAFAEHRQACSPDAPGGDCDESCGICGGLKKFGMWEEEPRPGWDEQRSRVANLEAALEFYADERHHQGTTQSALVACSLIAFDGGKRARTVLRGDSTS